MLENNESNDSPTWETLSRMVGNESRIILHGSSGKPLVKKITNFLPFATGEDRKILKRFRNPRLNAYYRLHMPVSGAENPRDNVEIEDLADTLHSLKGRIVRTFGNLKNAGLADYSIHGHTVLHSDHWLRQAQHDAAAVRKALEVDASSSKASETRNGIVERLSYLENILGRSQTIKHRVNNEEILADNNRYAKAKRVLLQENVLSESDRQKKSTRALHLYHSLLSNKGITGAIKGKLFIDTINVAADLSVFDLIRQLRKRGVDYQSIKSQAELLLTQRPGNPGRNDQILETIYPIIQTISSTYPHVYPGFTRMDALTDKNAVCAGKVRLLMDSLKDIKGLHIFESIPLIQDDMKGLGHTYVTASLDKDFNSIIEIDANRLPGVPPKIVRMKRTGRPPMTLSEFNANPVDIAGPHHYVYRNGQVYEYVSLFGARPHGFSAWINNEHPGLYNMAHELDVLYKFTDSDKRRVELAREREFLLSLDAVQYGAPDSMLRLASYYLYPLERIRLNYDYKNIMQRISDGLKLVDKYRRLNPYDPDGIRVLAHGLLGNDQVLRQWPTEKRQEGIFAIYAYINHLCENLVHLWPNRKDDATEILSEIVRVMKNPMLLSINEKQNGRIAGKYEGWNDAYKQTKHLLFNSKEAPITSKALIDWDQFST